MEIGIILTIVFVVLKLTHVIGWSWWWVFSPLWIGAIITGIMWATMGIGWLFIKARRKWRRDTLEVEKPLIETKVEYEKPKRHLKRKVGGWFLFAFGLFSLIAAIFNILVYNDIFVPLFFIGGFSIWGGWKLTHPEPK